MWRSAGRGKIQSDPVSFALSDRPSRLLVILMAVSALVFG